MANADVRCVRSLDSLGLSLVIQGLLELGSDSAIPWICRGSRGSEFVRIYSKLGARYTYEEDGFFVLAG